MTFPEIISLLTSIYFLVIFTWRISKWCAGNSTRKVIVQTNVISLLAYSTLFILVLFTGKKNDVIYDGPALDIVTPLLVILWIVIFIIQLFTLWIIAEVGIRQDKISRKQNPSL